MVEKKDSVFVMSSSVDSALTAEDLASNEDIFSSTGNSSVDGGSSGGEGNGRGRTMRVVDLETTTSGNSSTTSSTLQMMMNPKKMNKMKETQPENEPDPASTNRKHRIWSASVK